jgi:hypothetical protein
VSLVSAAPSQSRKCTWFCAGFLLFGLAGLAGTARVLLVAIDKVMSGRGLETYRTFWLVEFNYIGVLVLFGAVVVALAIGAGLWLYDRWQWRSLERKYGHSRGDT